jgi:hypothetical protein
VSLYSHSLNDLETNEAMKYYFEDRIHPGGSVLFDAN